MADCCSSSCDAGRAPDPRYRKVLWLALIVNAVMCLVEVVASVQAHSASLLADSMDFLGDVTNLLLEKKMLAPLYLRGKTADGTIENRIKVAIQDLEGRFEILEEERKKISEATAAGWDIEKALAMVPGELLLDKLCRAFGGSFQKQRGDTVRLARHLKAGKISPDIRSILEKITGA